MASSPSSPSSPSESDSDREPNSHGARVFWGNLKTPERSRSSFVNPPQTVVKSNRQAHPKRRSARLSTQLRIDDTEGGRGPVETNKDVNDETLSQAQLHEHMMREIQESEEKEDVKQPHLQEPAANADALSDSRLLLIPSQQSFLTTLRSLSSDAGSESEVEGEAVLQPSSSIGSPAPLTDGFAHPDASEGVNRSPTHSKPSSPEPRVQSPPAERPPLAFTTRASRTSELPDLISFDMTTPACSSLRPDATPPHRPPSSSSCATVDDLLSFSPQPSGSQSPPTLLIQDQRQDPEVLPKPISEAAVSPYTPSSQIQRSSFSEAYLVTNQPTPEPSSYPGQTSVQASTSTSLHGIGELPPFQRASRMDNLQGDVKIATSEVAKVAETLVVKVLQTADEAATHPRKESVDVPPSISSVETRKRSPAKARKGKGASDGDGSAGESSSTSNESDGNPGKGNDNKYDKDIRRERRAKAKQEAELRRRQLQSLSPTSVDVLNLLASPDRGSPSRPPAPRGPDGMDHDPAVCLDTAQPHGTLHAEPATPQAGPSSPARRVPVLDFSPQRLDGPPLHFIRPNPVPLEDPSRTPARRVPVASGSQAQPHPLPLDDPNRTPARRVVVLIPSSNKPADPLDSPATLVSRGQGSRARSDSLSPAKPILSKLLSQQEKSTYSSLALSPTATRITRPLPFPIPRHPEEGRKVAESSNPPSRHAIAVSPVGLPSMSSFRQLSSASGSKIARITAKPYSRPGHTRSKLPKPSSSRIPFPGATSNDAGPSRAKAPLGTVVPTRIPSPVKRRAPSTELPEPLPQPPSTSTAATGTEDKDNPRVTTICRRKRQRMMTEDDSDEPPAKRPVIVVRPVTKGMYNKAALAHRLPGSSTSRNDISPVRPARAEGPVQIRPVIPGTLGHFETTRSSSRDLVKRTHDDTQVTAESDITIASTAVVAPSSAPHAESPVADTDTASTVTTLSRESTLEDLSGPSSGVQPCASSPTLAEPEPELRRTTRVRKPYGPDALTMPSSSSSTSRRELMTITRTATMIQRGTSMTSKASSKSSTRTPKPAGLPTNPRQLQALTDANTVRNQAYLAELQREVVRKNGPRPASPTTKVRTIMEKSREESSKDREARAERRRRRGEGSNVTASSDGDFTDVPSSPLRGGQEPISDAPRKHVRGPGDEEEYETPLRLPKPSRLDPNKIAKNVRWDRGLAKSISEWAAEQLANQAREAAAAAEAVRKGCLARDATTLHLDHLGNVPDANAPLDDLGSERVVVTRFVYDDDEVEDVDVAESRAAKKRKS